MVNAVDPGNLLAFRSEPPPVVDRHSVVLIGAWLPLPLPVEAVSPDLASEWIVGNPVAPSAVRLRWALELDEERAWQLLDQEHLPIDQDARHVLATWIGRQLAEAKLPAPDGDLLIADTSLSRSSLVLAWSSVRKLFIALPHLPWHGPLLVDSGPTSLHPRPVLPRCRLPVAARDQLRDQAARLFARLLLHRLFIADQACPPWLEQGLAGVAEARAQGHGPSPRRMLAIRRRGGRSAWLQLVQTDTPDPELATAWCAVFVHTRQRAGLPSFIDLIRVGSDPSEAIRIAFGQDLEHWLRNP